MITTLTLGQAREATADWAGIAADIGIPVDHWPGSCHEVSLALLNTGRLGPGRVARGTADGITSQHSWIVLGPDCYAPGALIVDATSPAMHRLWNAAGRKGSPVLVTDKATGRTHWPHGHGSIWTWGKPTAGDGPVIHLTPAEPLSDLAEMFLGQLGPLDRAGWAILAHAPVQNWPAGEIVSAMYDTEELRALVPIDIVGMLTDRNPGGLYLPPNGVVPTTGVRSEGR